MTTESHEQAETEIEGQAATAAGEEASGNEAPATAATRPVRSPGRTRRQRPTGRAAPARTGFPLRNVVIFGGLVVVLLAAFGILGNQRRAGSPAGAPKWKIGETVQLDITLVTPDAKDLSCAMDGELAGRHCAFNANKAKNDQAKSSTEDDKLLQPYTTTDRVQFLASGLWMTEALKDKLAKEKPGRPGPRFSATCKYKVEGRTRRAEVQWKPGDAWYSANGWYTGTITECKLGN